VKPSEMEKGKRYRVIMEGEALFSTGSEAGFGEYGTSNILMDEAPHIVSIEEIIPEFPVGTVAIHRGDKSGIYVYRLFRESWYDMTGKRVGFDEVRKNVLGDLPIQYVLPEGS
jgi:hypothetical protein